MPVTTTLRVVPSCGESTARRTAACSTIDVVWVKGRPRPCKDSVAGVHLLYSCWSALVRSAQPLAASVLQREKHYESSTRLQGFCCCTGVAQGRGKRVLCAAPSCCKVGMGLLTATTCCTQALAATSPITTAGRIDCRVPASLVHRPSVYMCMCVRVWALPCLLAGYSWCCCILTKPACARALTLQRALCCAAPAAVNGACMHTTSTRVSIPKHPH